MPMALETDHHELGSDYWAVYLAAAIAGADTIELPLARKELRRALREFTKARIVTSDIREMIGKISKGETWLSE